MKRRLAFLLRLIASSSVLLCGRAARGAMAEDGVEARLQEIVRQNQRLQEQVQAQQKTIEALSAEVAAMRSASTRPGQTLQDLPERANAPAAAAVRSEAAVRLSGEAGLAFFRTGPAGPFPNSEFRLDDVKMLLEAPVRRHVYAVAELNLMTREANDEALHLGEMYVEVENLAGAWGAPDLVNLRAGRINVPFGEEYQVRGVLANPLISHSVSDVWGVDEGLEIYGQAGKFDYVLAVQNGGHSLLHDFNSDKAVIGRVGFAPNRWLRLSASAMRTGDLAKGDTLSEVWFGNGFFRAIGAAATTQTFAAELYEVDAVTRWTSGHLAGAVGWARYVDDDRAANNARDLDYYYVEGLQEAGENFYGVARYSAIRVPQGYPLVGWGNFGTYFYSGLLTERLDRLSLGFGYRFGAPMVWKFEYAIERGRLTTGRDRDHEDFLATELGIKF